MLLSKLKNKKDSKYLIIRKKKSAGRNNTGRITVAHQGGGHKQSFRKIILNGNFEKSFVTNFEYDPNRSCFIAKVCYFENGLKKFNYVLAPQNLKILDAIESSHINNLITTTSINKITVSKQIGNCYFLKEFSIGDFIYNIELIPNKGGQLVRAGGTSALVLQKAVNFTTVKLPSGEHRMIPNSCRAFYGNLTNENHNKII